MRWFDVRRLRRDERGEGVGTIIFYIILLGIVWFVVSFVVGYIYDKKTERAEAPQPKGRKHRVTTTTFVVRDPGRYTVEYNK